MLSLGLDIGTTSISLAVVDESSRVVHALSAAHDAFIRTEHPWEKIQDGSRLISIALEEVGKLCDEYPVSCIGVTGQQHGIIYLDSGGNIVSPLYTWQDGRANLTEDGESSISLIKKRTGWSLSAGFGLATHFYNLKNGLVPENAACFAAIADVAAMRLAGNTKPVTEASNAHSFGMFDIGRKDFDRHALEECGMRAELLPEVFTGRHIGSYRGIPVSIAIGDNQASFIGATGGDKDAALVNVGTGSQISLHTDTARRFSQMELRPYPLGGYLLVGAGLCGGRTWALTENFFRQTVYKLTGIDKPAYESLDRMLSSAQDDGSHPRVNTCFDGTRNDPDKRGSIDGISVENFTPEQFAFGILHGMTDELHEMYLSCLKEGQEPKDRLIGSGNGLRLNAHLQRITSSTFGMKLEMSECEEEAAVGAAVFSRELM